MVLPSIRHVYLSLASYANWDGLHVHSDNLALLTSGAIEAYHMLFRPMSSSWIESVYGLSRVRVSPRLAPLGTCQRIVSLCYLLLMPRIIAWLQSLRRESEAPAPDASPRARFLHQLRSHLSTLLSLVGDGLFLAEQASTYLFRLLYLIGRSRYHHPVFALLQMEIFKTKHATPLANSNSDAETSPSNTERPADSGSNWTMRLIVGLIFAAKLAAWITSNDLSEHHLNRKIAAEQPIPDPPKPSKVCAGGVIPPADARLCPLCCKTRQDPCAATSGYVYCYLCIVQALRQNRSCPVTGVPCQESDLVRLYDH